MSAPSALGAAGGLALDRLLGDPPNRWHPVAWFGAAMARRDRGRGAARRRSGLAHALAGVALGAAAAGALDVAGRACGHPTITASIVAATVIGGRSLERSATAIAAALAQGDLDEARRLLPTLVGRDPSGLDASEIARAVVESLAENTVDAVVAPVVWAAALGPVGAGAYRAINTLDAMVGHRSERYRNFGWVSARLDDAANWVPARIGALAVAVVRPQRAGAVWRAVRDQAPAHPSPNAGVIEAAFAAALGIGLGGRNVYGGRVEYRVPLGRGPSPGVGDIARARTLARDVNLLLMAGLIAPAAGGTARRRSSRRSVR